MKLEDIQYTVGQRWLQIDGAFTSDELRIIADKIDEAYNRALKKPESIENNGGSK